MLLLHAKERVCATVREEHPATSDRVFNGLLMRLLRMREQNDGKMVIGQCSEYRMLIDVLVDSL